MRMAIMGAGSLGTIIGALLTKNGYEVDLIDSNVQHVEALNKSGAKIVGLMELVQPVKALTPEQMTGEYDLFLYLVKSTQHDSALPYVAKHLKPQGVVVAMQKWYSRGCCSSGSRKGENCWRYSRLGSYLAGTGSIKTYVST